MNKVIAGWYCPNKSCGYVCYQATEQDIEDHLLFCKFGKTTQEKRVIDFLRESNAIESVYDDVSLRQAIYAWQYLIEQPELTPGVILKTHKILMLHQDLLPSEKGFFREVAVWVGATYGADWKQVPNLIAQWCDIVGWNIKTMNKTAFKMLHVSYERIHPFVDGNGRTGRMFMNWYLVKVGYPILVIKEAKKRSYYKWFEVKK